MIFNIILPLLGLAMTYALVILGLILILRRTRAFSGRAIFLGFLVFGVTTGVLTAWVWPIDSSVYFNIFGTLLGDWVYNWSVQHLGDPWLLRVPQVYVLASTVLCGVVGLLLQWMYNRQTRDEQHVHDRAS